MNNIEYKQCTETVQNSGASDNIVTTDDAEMIYVVYFPEVIANRIISNDGKHLTHLRTREGVSHFAIYSSNLIDFAANGLKAGETLKFDLERSTKGSLDSLIKSFN